MTHNQQQPHPHSQTSPKVLRPLAQSSQNHLEDTEKETFVRPEAITLHIDEARIQAAHLIDREHHL